MAALFLKSIILIHFNNFKDLLLFDQSCPQFPPTYPDVICGALVLFIQKTESRRPTRQTCESPERSCHCKQFQELKTDRNWPNIVFCYAHGKPSRNQPRETNCLSHEIQNWVNEKESLTRDIEIPCGTIFILLQSSTKQQLHKYLKICAALHPAVSWAPHLTENCWKLGAMFLFVSRQQELRNDRYIIWSAGGLNNGTRVLLGRCDAFLERKAENSHPTVTIGLLQPLTAACSLD